MIECSIILNVSVKKLRRALKTFGIYKHKRYVKIKIPLDKLKKYYCDDFKSMAECAKIFGVNRETIEHRIKDLGIKSNVKRMPKGEKHYCYKPRIFIKCANCNQPFLIKSSHTHRKFCGVDCQRESISKRFPGKKYGPPNGRYRTTDIPCLYCGKPLISRQKKFCSSNCKAKFWIGENHPRYCEPVKLKCKICDKEFLTTKYWAKKGRQYCSRECASKYRRGINHPSWNGGPEKSKERQRLRIKNDPKINLNSRMATAIRRSLKLKRGGSQWENWIGYNVSQLHKRLQKTMPKNYSWIDYLNGDLQIDHIIPVSVFNFDSINHIDFHRCWSLENLRLLPTEENRLKKDHINKPFQPSLKLAC